MVRNSIMRCARVATVAAALALGACQTSTQAPPTVQSNTTRVELAGLGNPASPFSVSVWPEMKIVARIGEKLNLGIRATADSHISLFNVGSSGQVARLLDNKFTRAGETLHFPSADGPVDFQITAPAGVETFVVVASRAPLRILYPGDVQRGGRLALLSIDSHTLASRIRGATTNAAIPTWNADVVDVITTY